MVDLKALVPWRDKSNAPAPREEHRDPFLTFRREVDRMFDDFFRRLRPPGSRFTVRIVGNADAQHRT